MKKIFGMLGAAALLTLASCSNENFDEPNVVPGQEGDMFVTMNINQIANVGTRTSTPSQGVEIGKDFENNVTDALVIFATKASDGYKVFKSMYVGQNDITGTNGKYAATFKMDRQTLIDDIGGEEKQYHIFVIGNPSTAMTTKASEINDGTLTNQFVQDLFSVTANTAHDATTYWTQHHFLMSSAGYSAEAESRPEDGVNSCTIKAADIAEGTHTSAGDPYQLGTVRIQRAMSRFDMDVDKTNVIFTAENPNNDLKKVNIEIVGVSLVNEATEVNLFKVTDLAAKWTGYDKEKTINFVDESATNWVFSPTQEAFRNPLFTGTIANGTFESTAKKVDVDGLVYTPISTIQSGYEDNTFTHPGNTPTDVGAYRIWRYAMENTFPNDAEKQVNGNSTGIVFKAKMSFGGSLDEDGNLTGNTNPVEGGAVYAFSNTFLGGIAALRTYAIEPKAENDETGVYEQVNIRFIAAVEKYNATQTEAAQKFVYGDADVEGATGISLRTATADQLAVLDSELVKQEFSIYRPDTDGNYYCYYTYWNRHNDNGQNTVMGVMEFATVRNNVYKIKVTKIHKLGHPGKTDDDPDPETPPTPDEEDEFYISVACEVLPWEVRINNVEL